MSLVWLVPTALATLAAALTASAARSVQHEVAAVEASLRRLAPMADQARSVRVAVAQTAQGTDRSLDSLGTTPRR